MMVRFSRRIGALSGFEFSWAKNNARKELESGGFQVFENVTPPLRVGLGSAAAILGCMVSIPFRRIMGVFRAG